MGLLSESMERLQWRAFFDEYSFEKYTESLKLLKEMKQHVSEKNRINTKAMLDYFITSADNILKDFEEFRMNKMAESETFLYWERFIEMVCLAKDLVRIDRKGLLPYFAAFDPNNYLRWGTIYPKDMKLLLKTAPEIHYNFQAECFVVNRASIPSSVMAADMCLEQTNNQSSKTSGGIIGNTKRKELIALWNITQHELMSVNHTVRKIARVVFAVNHNYVYQETNSRGGSKRL